jgi:RNA polymerase sigma-70 factor (ECF subfamily)
MSEPLSAASAFDGDVLDDAFVAELSLAATAADSESLTAMMPAVYHELRRLAAAYLGRERPEHTLQPTALVHEAYLRLSDQRQLNWQNRAHLLGIAARMMRRILTNHAVARAAARRGGEDVVRLSLDDALDVYDRPDLKLLDVDEALRALDALDSRQAQIVEMRFFGGLTVEEISEVLGISPRTVMREWSVAKRWLQRELAECA